MKKFRQITVIWLLLVLLTVMTASCTQQQTDKNTLTDEAAINVGVMVYRFDDQFIDALIDVMKSEVQMIQNESTINVHFEFVDARNQQDIQYDQLVTFIEEGYDALAINLVDRREAAKVIGLAKEADIPIVFFNRQPVQEDMARWNRTYYVGTDGAEAGLLQGDIVINYFEDNPASDKNQDGVIQYVMLQGQPGHQDAILRSRHSIRAIEDAGMTVEELASDTANWQRSEAEEKMTTWLNVFGNDIELVLSNNDAMAIGAIDAMVKAEVDLIPTVGVDAIQLAVDALKNGELIGTILNDAKAQGEGVVKIAYYLAIDEDPADFVEGIEVGKYLWVPYQRLIGND